MASRVPKEGGGTTMDYVNWPYTPDQKQLLIEAWKEHYSTYRRYVTQYGTVFTVILTALVVFLGYSMSHKVVVDERLIFAVFVVAVVGFLLIVGHWMGLRDVKKLRNAMTSLEKRMNDHCCLIEAELHGAQVTEGLTSHIKVSMVAHIVVSCLLADYALLRLLYMKGLLLQDVHITFEGICLVLKDIYLTIT
jgi:hypothetical protein